MKETMGQIIRRLRKQSGFTQDELAEQLGVTFQAVSKWENDTGMPDISQIVPLAAVFGVSTDELFGFCGTDREEEARKVIEKAVSLISHPASKEMIRESYKVLRAGLEQYPNNTALIMQCLETGITLAYPENGELCDAENGADIYRECIREADLVIKYGKNASDILRAHMIMVLLHSAYGDSENAAAHAEVFPWRADMTGCRMKGYIAHWKGDRAAESACCQTDLVLHLEAMLDDIVDAAICMYHLERYQDAAESLTKAMSLIALICGGEDVCPRFHVRETGDIHSLLAKAYLKLGRKEDALRELDKMADYDIEETAKFGNGKKPTTPLLRDVFFSLYRDGMDFSAALLKKLEDRDFDEIRSDPEFVRITEKAKA